MWELISVGIGLIGMICLGLVAMLAYFVLFSLTHFGLWLELRAAGIPLTFANLLQCKFQGLPEAEVADSMKTLWKAGLHVPLKFLQSHVLAGGSLSRLTQAAIAAEKAGLNVDYQTLSAIDLAGRDILDAVKTSVMPKVLVCPPQGGAYGNRGIVGVTQDGVSVSVKVRITVRMKLDQLVGGAGEATVIARVGEGIVSTLGRAKSHKDILERPEVIAETILAKGLDSGTCFEILSVDIANVDVLENVRAKLALLRADADKRIAQAKSARAKADAKAQQQEMQAMKLENEAKVVQAKALLPQAFKTAMEGNRVGARQPFRPLLPDRISLWQFGLEGLGPQNRNG